MNKKGNVLQPRIGQKIVFQPSFPGQEDVFLPDVEVCFRQEPTARKELFELLLPGVTHINLDGEKPDHIPQEQWDRPKQTFDEIYEDAKQPTCGG